MCTLTVGVITALGEEAASLVSKWKEDPDSVVAVERLNETAGKDPMLSMVSKEIAKLLKGLKHQATIA